MDQETLSKLTAFMQEHKGKRKFSQSVELSLNFTGIDFAKQDNRLNLEVKLPNGKGKEMKFMVFADDRSMSEKAQTAGAEVVPGGQLQSIVNDKQKMKELLDYELLAQPSLMPQIARYLGQYLGPRGKMPRPVVGDVGKILSEASKSIYVRNKGKFLPTVHCVVGNEKMDANQIAANIDEVINTISKKVGGKSHIKSAYLKLTMSPPMKVI